MRTNNTNKMHYCSIPNCHNKSGGGARLFPLPKGKRNAEKRNQWIKSINRDNLPLTIHICEDHFTDDQFENRSVGNVKLLKTTAVPTIFPCMEPNSKQFTKEKETDSLKQKHEKFVVMCRTCLTYKEKQTSSIMMMLIRGKTVKEMVLRLIPQIAQTITEDDYVCKTCVRCLCKCIEFIDNCLEFETRIRDGQLVYNSEEKLLSDDENSDSVCKEENLTSSVEQLTDSQNSSAVENFTDDILQSSVKTSEKSISLKLVSSKDSVQQNKAAQLPPTLLKKSCPSKMVATKISIQQNNTNHTPKLFQELNLMRKGVSENLRGDTNTDEILIVSVVKRDTDKEQIVNIIPKPPEKEEVSDNILRLEYPNKVENEMPDEKVGKKQVNKKKFSNDSTEESSNKKSTTKPLAKRSSKRNRTKRKLDDCAKDEEIDAYLKGKFDARFDTSEEEKDDLETTPPKKGRRRKDKDDDYIVEEKVESAGKHQALSKLGLRKRATSPELQVMHNLIKGSIRTYERKKKIVVAENISIKEEPDSSPAVRDIVAQQNTDEIIQPTENLKNSSEIITSLTEVVVEGSHAVITIDEDPTIISPQIGESETNSSCIHQSSAAETSSDHNDDKSLVEVANKIDDLSTLENIISEASSEDEDAGPSVVQNKDADPTAVQNEDTKGRYKCPACQIGYRSRRGLRDHMCYEHCILPPSNYDYTCNICLVAFSVPEELVEHRNSHGVPCNFCKEIFKSVEQLDLHKNSHPPLYLCIVCNRAMKTEKELTIHSSMHDLMHELMQEKELPPKNKSCHWCGMKFRFKGRLTCHINLVHLKQKNHKCNTCGKTFGLQSSLNMHIRVRHLVEKPFKCSCGMAFKRNDYLKKHKLNKHMQRTNKANAFCCEFCDKVSEDKISYKEHLNTHAGIRKYKCRYCELRFVRQNTKLVHERSHITSPFVCNICWRKCTSQNQMEMHMAGHNRVKRFKCALCPRFFTRKMLLEIHILDSHTVNTQEVKQE